MIVETLQRLADELPPPLLPPQVPTLPDFSSLGPLAQNLGVDPARVTEELQRHGLDSATLDTVSTQAQGLVDAAIADITELGIDLLRRALPVAAQMLVPALRPAATAQLSVMAGETLGLAGVRVGTLAQELAPLVLQLDGVAAEAPAEVAPPLEQASPAQAPATEEEPAAEEMEPVIQQASISQPTASGQGEAAVQAALGQVGTPYVWGGTSPSGFDCSGLVQWAYGQAGVELPRTAAEMTTGQEVSYEQLQPGDLAVWDGHVAMYAGDGMMVEAGDPVQTNPVRTSNMGMGFLGFWRPTA